MNHIGNQLKLHLKIIAKKWSREDQLNLLQLDQYALRIKFYYFFKVFIDTVRDPDLSTIPYRTLYRFPLQFFITLVVSMREV